MPIAFSNNYQNAPGELNTNSTLVKGVSCLENQSDGAQGTALASPMKAAARYLLGIDTNNLSSLLPARTLVPQKVIIFETDGQPNERATTGGSTTLTTAGDVFSDPLDTDGGVTVTGADTSSSTTVTNTITTTITHNKTKTYTYTGGAKACQNFLDVATKAKAAGITVIMIGYNMSYNNVPKSCSDFDGVADNYSNLYSVQEPQKSAVNTSSTAVTTGPEAQTQAACPYPNGSKTCIKKYQTSTTTKYQRAAVSTSVLSVMASAASPVTDSDGNVTQASAQSDCSTEAEQDAENSDGDYLFCAASGTDMAPIFRTALSQATKGIKLVRLP